MNDDLFVGLTETGWDRAPWDTEPIFSQSELDVLLDWSIPAEEAAERIGCVEHDVLRVRQTSRDDQPTTRIRRELSA